MTYNRLARAARQMLPAAVLLLLAGAEAVQARSATTPPFPAVPPVTGPGGATATLPEMAVPRDGTSGGTGGTAGVIHPGGLVDPRIRAPARPYLTFRTPIIPPPSSTSNGTLVQPR